MASQRRRKRLGYSLACFAGALDGGYTFAQFYVETVGSQDYFEAGDYAEHVGDVEVA
jgi:hypothetical protein